MRILLGALLLDLERAVAIGPAGRHPLTPLECRFLQRLADAKGETVDRGELLTDVWGYRAQMVTRTVDVAVARLRAKIEPDPATPLWLRSERGAGYRLVDGSASGESAPPPAPPLDHAVIGRDVEIATLLAALSAGAAQLCGVPGMGLRAVARAVAARWSGPVAWIPFDTAEAPLDTVSARMGWTRDAVNVAARLAGFPGLVVLEGADGSLDGRPRRLFVGGPPRRDARVVTLSPLGEGDGVALVHALAPREVPPDEAAAVIELVRASRGLPALLALHARELRFARAEALLIAHAPGEDQLRPAWRAARSRLGAVEQAALDVLGRMRTDFPYPVAVVLMGAAGVTDVPTVLDALVRAGWLTTGWSATGEVRLRAIDPTAGDSPLPPAVGAWLLALPDAALLREAPLALSIAGALAPDDPSLVRLIGRLHGVVRVRGGWGALRAALERVPPARIERAVAYARAEAAWYAGDAAGAVAGMLDAVARTPPDAPEVGETRALCAFYLSRTGDREGARRQLAAVPRDDSRGAIEATFIDALLDSEDGAGGPEAIERLAGALTAAERFGDVRFAARARAYLATALWHRGAAGALAQFRRAVDEFRSLDARANAALVQSVESWAHADTGDLHTADLVAAEAEAALRLGGLLQAAAGALRGRAAFAMARGQLAQARTWLLQVLALHGEEEALVRAQLAWVESKAGAGDDAARHAAATRDALPQVAEQRAAVMAWLAAAGFGEPPDQRWLACSPEVRLVARWAN